MGLETATYINGLVITNPDGSDSKAQGDDHLRLIKKTLKASFPNITGAVTETQDDLNKTAVVGNFCFPGMIVMWSGTVVSIPSGWKLCNGVGTISTGGGVPDLRSRFIQGTDGVTGGAIGSTGGSAAITLSGSTGGTALTVDQMPSHTHSLNPSAQYSTDDDPINAPVKYLQGDPAPGIPWPGTADLAARGYIQATGGGAAHSHSVSVSEASANTPPYYALCFLIKN